MSRARGTTQSRISRARRNVHTIRRVEALWTFGARALGADDRRSISRGREWHGGLRSSPDRELERGHGQYPHTRHVPDLAAEDLWRDRAPNSPALDGPHAR